MDKNKNNAGLQNIAKLLNNQKALNRSIEQSITGMTHFNGLDSTKNKINKVITAYKTKQEGNFFDNMLTLKDEFNAKEKRYIDKCRELISNDKNMNMFRNILLANDSLNNRIDDLLLCTDIMPQLRNIRRAVVTSIMSPDDYTKQLAVNLTVDGKPLSEVCPALYDNMKNYMENKYEITKEIKHGVKSAVTLGKYYFAVQAYSDLFTDLVNRKEKNVDSVGHQFLQLESTNVNKEDQEKIDISKYELLNESYLKEYVEDIDKLKDDICKVCNNCTISTNLDNLFEKEAILAEKTKLQKDKDLYTPKPDKNSPYKIQDVDKYEVTNGLFDDKKNNVNINGAKVKKLDPRRLISFDIDDTNLGYLYVDTRESLQLLKDPNKYFNVKNNITIMDKETTTDLIYKNIGNLIWKKLDVKFIENHSDIKDRLYDVLKYADVNNDSQIHITYLNTDDVIKFEINEGESIFESSLFYSRLYLMVLLTTITAKATRANDIRAYTVNVDQDGGVDSMVRDAINSLQRNNSGILHANHITKLISAYSSFEDIFLEKEADTDTHPMDIDVISGQNVDSNTELLEMLEGIAADTIGWPLQLLQSNREADFARSYTTLNLAAMKFTFDLQIDLNPSLTQMYRKIVKYEEIDEEHKKIAEKLEAKFQVPMDLHLSNLLEKINNVRDAATTIKDTFIENQTEKVSPEAHDKIIVSLCKMLAPSIDWEGFQKLIDKIIEENPVEQDTTGEDNSGY